MRYRERGQMTAWIETDTTEDGMGTVCISGIPQDSIPQMTLISPQGETIPLVFREMTGKSRSFIADVEDPEKWDPEHPVLYRYELVVHSGSSGSVEVSRGTGCSRQSEKPSVKQVGRIGFRHMEIRGRELLWNNTAVRLYGVAYRERKNDPAGTRRDLELFKAAHVNFLRSIYGCFDRALLELADEMGFWVEDTASLWNIGTTGPALQNLPHLKDDFCGKVGELLDAGSHVSVLIWSLGQECAWGSNFREMRRLLRSIDQVRPITFHLPMSVPEEEKPLDLWPCAYTDIRLDFNRAYDQMVVFHTPGAENPIGYMTADNPWNAPVLQEIWSPVPCHDRDEIERDPSIHEFWGRSIAAFADKAWKTEGCLGGAVLAGVDEDGSFPELDGCQWGILDARQEPKPEYAGLAKAYHPLQLSLDATDGNTGEYRIRVENRFLFTALQNISLVVNGSLIRIFSLEPGAEISISSGYTLQSADSLDIRLLDQHGRELADKFERIRISAVRDRADSRIKKNPDSIKADAFEMVKKPGRIVLISRHLTYILSEERCLLQSAQANGIPFLSGGPKLDAHGYLLGPWRGKNLTVHLKNGGSAALICIVGTYENSADVCFNLRVTVDGKIGASCTVTHLYRPMPHIVKANIGLAAGGLSEKGISWIFPEITEAVVEDRAHRNARILRSGAAHDVFRAVFRTGSFSGEWAAEGGESGDGSVSGQEQREIAEVRFDGNRSVLLHPVPEYIDDTSWHYSGTWYQMDDYCGDHNGTETMSDEDGASAELTFTGTGIELYGPLGMRNGSAWISVDGTNEKKVEEYLPKIDQDGASRGYEKRYGIRLYSCRGLPEGRHVITVKPEGNSYFSIDGAAVYGAGHSVRTEVSVLEDYNYPRLVRGCLRREPVMITEGEILSSEFSVII